MTEPVSPVPLRVLVAGGGVAALETVLALRALAGDRVDVTLIAPDPDLLLRPLSVAEPFGRGHVRRLALTELMADVGGRHHVASVARVDAVAGTVALDTGHELAYGALVLALGATRVPAWPDALTFGLHRAAIEGVLADLDGGWARSVAFVVPPGCSWPLPLYELALLTAHEERAADVELHLLTPEPEPLGIFGTRAGAATRALLAEAGVALHVGHVPHVAPHGRVVAGEVELQVDRVIALPLLEGPALPGVPREGGYFAVDDAGRVAGLERVFAVGDATDRPVKQGGLACQQADVTAAAVAVVAGVAIEVPALEQVLRGRLLTGTGERFLRRAPGEAAGAAEPAPLWWPPAKISGRHLSPYLVAKGMIDLPLGGPPPATGVDVDVAVRESSRALL